MVPKKLAMNPSHPRPHPRPLPHPISSRTHRCSSRTCFIKSHIMNAGKIYLGKQSRDLPSVVYVDYNLSSTHALVHAFEIWMHVVETQIIRQGAWVPASQWLSVSSYLYPVCLLVGLLLSLYQGRKHQLWFCSKEDEEYENKNEQDGLNKHASEGRDNRKI